MNIVRGGFLLRCSTSFSNIRAKCCRAQNATDVLTESLEQTGSVRAQLGAIINRYERNEGASMRGMDMREARSRIRDAEYAEELQSCKQQILAQASMAMLSQANASKVLC